MRILVLVATLAVVGATGSPAVVRGAGALVWEAAVAGEETLHLELRDAEPEAVSRGVLTIPFDRLTGLTPEAAESGTPSVQFQLGRDAGRFNFSGGFLPGRGRGNAEFLPDAGYLKVVESLGPGPLTPFQLLVLAVHDVKIPELEELALSGYRNLSFADLVDMLIHGSGRTVPGSRGLLGMDAFGTGSLVGMPR
jgi:hypothetical protein